MFFQEQGIYICTHTHTHTHRLCSQVFCVSSFRKSWQKK